MKEIQSVRQQYTFEQVHQQYTRLVKGMVKRLNIHSNYEDFLQVGYLGLWMAYRDHDPEQGPFSAYAYARVRGEMLTHLRKEANYSDHYIAVSNHVTDKQYVVEFPLLLEADDLLPYLKVLSEKERYWAEAHALEDLAPRMIAKRYGVAVETVKDWRKRALKKLRTHLQK